MQKTRISWCDYSINPIKGLCPVGCEYCYARKMYRRFKWNPEIQWDEQCLIDLRQIKQPSRIFVGSTMELFGEWVGDNAVEHIFDHISDYPQHTFIFLTKCPQNLTKWSPFPPNCWVGVSVTNQDDANKRLPLLAKVDATIHFVSLEPLLDEVNLKGFLPGWANAGSTFEDGEGVERYDLDWTPVNPIDWVILGSRTQPVRHPPRAWVDEIISAADQAKIPIFVKEPMASHFGINRKEFPAPKGRGR